MRAARDGSGITTIADRQQHPTGLLLTSDHVYWVNQGGVGESGQFGSNDGSVKGISLDGSSGQMTIASSQRRPVSLATDGANNLYWSARGLNNGSQTSDGAIWTCNLANCVPRVLASPLVFPQQLLFRSPSLYWTSETVDSDQQMGSIWQMASAGGTASRVFVDAVKANRMAFSADASTLYYSSSVLHTVIRRPRSGAGATRYTGNFDPQAILSAPPRIYRLNSRDGSLAGSIARAGQDDLLADGTAPSSLKTFPLPAPGGEAIVDDDRGGLYFTTESAIMKMIK